MSERAAYSRVYWSIVDDLKFVSVYDDDHHLAGWLRLLLIADQAHPASAHLPANVRRATISVLSEVELIDLLPGHRYRVHGLDAERERRRLAATTRGTPKPVPPPDGDRTVTKRSPSGPGTTGLRRDETRRDETSRARAQDDEAPETEAIAWLARHKVVLLPHDGYYRHLLMAVERHGIEAVLAVLEELHGAGMPDGDTKGYVFGVRDELDRRKRPNLRAVEKGEDERRVRDRRAEQFERVKLRAHDNGYHADERDPGCPRCREVA